MKGEFSSSLETNLLALPVSGRDHIQGPMNAPVTLVEYGDYECPACGDVYWVTKRIQIRLAERLRFAFRNFPMTSIHPHSEQAAEAAEAAGARDRFWEMHDVLYEHQNALEDENIAQYAEALDLDVPRLMGEVEAHAYSGRIQEDFMSGIRSGVNAAPAFFINGRRYTGAYDLESLLYALLEASVWEL